MFNCGNYTQKHLRDAATAESKRTLSTSKSFTRVPVPFCNERGLRKKLSCALYWHQDLVRAMLLVARDRPVFAPLVRSHLRGVRYGISRQVQHYLERLSELCSKPSSSSLAPGMQPLTIDGLYKWSQTYSKAWMMGFEVRHAASACRRSANVLKFFYSTKSAACKGTSCGLQCKFCNTAADTSQAALLACA